MKILITGAHFTPAMAVIEELVHFPNVELIYIGRKYTLEGDKTTSAESRILPSLGIKFLALTTGRLARTLTIYTIPSLLKIPIGFLQAGYYLVKEKPAVVLSFGGYVSVPVVVLAWVLNIPIVCHEQTLVTSLANKINSWFATKILVSFEADYSFPKEKILQTGNPIRKQLLVKSPSNIRAISRFVAKAKNAKLPIVYITGGNQGSHIINQTIAGILEQLTKIAFVIHQTGDSKFQDFRRLSSQSETLVNQERYLVTKWVDVEDLREVLSQASLIISRAGANILTELAYFGKPVILIPVPYLYHDEQMVNAKYFKRLGLGQIIPQSNLSPPLLFETIKRCLKDEEKLIKAAGGAKKIVYLDAAKRIAQEVIGICQKHVS